MNTYRNKRTGAEVVTASIVTGEEWELVKPKNKPKDDKPKDGEDK